MKIVTIVQARVRSTRLPAKVLLDLGGATVLERTVARARRIRRVDEVVVATSDLPEDDLIVGLAARIGVPVSRGSETDVLSRFLVAAHSFGADAVVRVTSDCPLLDPEESSVVVEHFMGCQSASEPLDYASNVVERTLPRGLDTEIFRVDALERAGRTFHDAPAREHVTHSMYREGAPFRHAAVKSQTSGDMSQHRWTLDTLEDYRFLCAVFGLLGPSAATADFRTIAAALADRPDIRAINAGVAQKVV